MRRRDVGVIMKSCVAALSAAVVLTAMPAQVNAAPTKSVTVSTQASLNNALKNSKVGTINIKTTVKKNFSIPKGKFNSKSVVMNAPNASLTNNGTLKGMTIKNANIVTEKADNNKINITDKGLRLIVAKGADNSKVSIGTRDAKVTVVADGKVASVSVNKKALVAVTGKTTKPVSVTSTVAGTGLILASKANVSLKNSTNVDVRKGADLGTVTAYNNASLKVAKGAKIATLNSTGDKASVKLVTNGAVGNVVLKKQATVTITGEPSKKVAVTNNASGSLVKLGVKADVKATQPTTVNAYKGSEIGKVTATKELVLNVGSGAKVDTVEASKELAVNAYKGSEVGTVTGNMDVEVKVAVGAKVDAVKSQGEEAKVTVTANGTVGDVVIDGKAEVTVEGTTTKPVNVTSNAADSLVIVNATSNITLNESASVTVAEGAKVESLTATKDVALNVSTGAEVAEVVVKGTDAKVDVTANGTVGAVTIDAKAEVSIKGETDSSVVVNANVESAKINTEVKTEVNANANVDITLGEGAEGSKVVAGEDVNASVKNDTKEDVTITDSTGKDTTVDSGKTGDTKPVEPETPPVYVPSYSTYYVKDKTELTVALEKASKGDVIVITNTIGVTNSPDPKENFGNYDITKAVTITSNNKDAVVYGTFTILTDGVTISNIKISNRTGGSDKEKNAINIVASKATVTNNYISAAGTGKVANGILIYPTSSTVDYNITGNTIEHFSGVVDGWGSTAIALSERLDLDYRFGKGVSANLVPEYTNEEKTTLSNTGSNWSIDMDEKIATKNTFKNCGNEYIHDDWGVTHGKWADYIYDYCVDGQASDGFVNTTQRYSETENAKMVIVSSDTNPVVLDVSKTLPENVTVEVRSGKVVVNSVSTITINGSLIIGEGATLEISDGCTIVNNGTITNNGTIIDKGSEVLKVLKAAKEYNYPDTGTYTKNYSSLEISDVINNKVTIKFTYSYADGDGFKIVNYSDSKGVRTRPVGNLVDDFARYIGAIYRCDENTKSEGNIVDKITFNNTDYKWNGTSLYGSNWRTVDEANITLMSQLFPSSALTSDATTEQIEEFVKNLKRVIKIGDIEIEFTAELNKTA